MSNTLKKMRITLRATGERATNSWLMLSYDALYARY